MAPAVYEGVFNVPNGIFDTFLKATQFTKVGLHKYFILKL